MDDATLHEQLDHLRKEINLHNYRYYVLDAPLISDYEYDRMMNELRQIETDHPDWITPDSPSQRTGGAPVEKFARVRHPSPILSLANGFRPEDIRAWYERLTRIDDRVERTSFVI
ncbi:MAG TPA: NAD-dependent DNA ligase LigA, partial [Anaerolineaceae bacterium]|nr:NAD-dependent DNA ligase LigA [Anaerolineaceae bacterium]